MCYTLMVINTLYYKHIPNFWVSSLILNRTPHAQQHELLDKPPTMLMCSAILPYNLHLHYSPSLTHKNSHQTLLLSYGLVFTDAT